MDVANPEPKCGRPRISLIEAVVVFAMLLMSFRITALIALTVLGLLYFFYPFHRSNRALLASFCIYVAALLIPVDVYISGHHGPLINSQHSGPRLVRVLYGLGAGYPDGRESISGGCILTPSSAEWMLVWD